MPAMCYRPPMSTSDPIGRVPLSDRIAVLLLLGLGVWVIAAPGFLGWDYFRTRGLGLLVLRILTGFLFLFYAVAVVEKNRLRRRLGEIHEAMNMLLYGRNYRRDREAIRILIRGLASREEEVRRKAWENLRKLTGRDFALDEKVWRSWWEANEKRFALKSRRPDD